MDDEKDVPYEPDTVPAKTPGITEGVAGLVSSITQSVKEVASTVAANITIPAAISNRVETAHPPVEENFDALPMTAEELAEHAAADTQPSAKKAKRRPAALNASRRITPAPVPDTPLPSSKKAARTASKKTEKAGKKSKAKSQTGNPRPRNLQRKRKSRPRRRLPTK